MPLALVGTRIEEVFQVGVVLTSTTGLQGTRRPLNGTAPNAGALPKMGVGRPGFMRSTYTRLGGGPSMGTFAKVRFRHNNVGSPASTTALGLGTLAGDRAFNGLPSITSPVHTYIMQGLPVGKADGHTRPLGAASRMQVLHTFGALDGPTLPSTTVISPRVGLTVVVPS